MGRPQAASIRAQPAAAVDFSARIRPVVSDGGEAPRPSRSPPSPHPTQSKSRVTQPAVLFPEKWKDFKTKSGRQIGRKNGPERRDPVQGFAKLDHPVSREIAGKNSGDRGPCKLGCTQTITSGVRDDRGPGMMGPGRSIGLVADRCGWHRVRHSTVLRSNDWTKIAGRSRLLQEGRPTTVFCRRGLRPPTGLLSCWRDRDVRRRPPARACAGTSHPSSRRCRRTQP